MTYLGIFWGWHDENGLPHLTTIRKRADLVPLIAGFRTLDQGHMNIWPHVQRKHPFLRTKEYDEVPRGRVNWREEDQRYLLIADRCFNEKKFRIMVISRFNLPQGRTLMMNDEHYRVQTCCFNNK